ncbi:MAG: hypothetical protein IPP07_05600 [Holophagales bacterium]|nr:hypothetical protein [Holophagales bacterium]MBK9964388.1 hypothetical protein [Holophagales bacterium]
MEARESPRNRFARSPRVTLLAVLVVLLAAMAGLLELLVRTAAIDFFAPELRRGTPAADLGPSSLPTILALGDSFTANPDGWVACLREGLGPATRVVGSGVSGFTARQIARIAPRRVARFAPRVVVLQLYAGNDLLELKHPVDWRRGRPLRNLFWTLSDAGLEAPGLLNHRAGQLAAAVIRRTGRARITDAKRLALEARPFSPALFTARDRELLSIDPFVLERQLRLTGGMEEAFARYGSGLRSILDTCRAGGTRVLVFVVPHAVEVDPLYRKRFEALGARFEDPGALEAPESPFGLAVQGVVASAPGAAFLDVKPALREAQRCGTAVYRNNDSHFSPEGDRVVARVVLDALSSPGLDLSGAAGKGPGEK